MRFGAAGFGVVALMLFSNPAGAASVAWEALPEAVRAAVEDAVPGLEIDDIEERGRGGDRYYEIEGERNGNEVELRIDRSGDVLSLEIDNGSSSAETVLPIELEEILDEVAPGIAIREVELRGHGDTRQFHVEGTVVGREAEARLTLDGEVLRFRLAFGDDASEDTDAGGALLPQAVLDTLADIVPDMAPERISYNPGADHPFYRVHGTVDDRRVAIAVSTEGAVLLLEFDSDADGLDDATETDLLTDPNDSDSDDDLYPDGFERRQGSNPLAAESTPQLLSIHHEYVGGTPKIVLSVALFEGALFQIEQCPEHHWVNIGEEYRGRDGEVLQMEMPVGEGNIYRVTVKPGEEDAKKEGENEEGEDETTTPANQEGNPGDPGEPGGEGVVEEEETQGGNDDGEDCAAPPGTLEGVSLEIGGLEYRFTSETEGKLVFSSDGDGDVEFLAFSYSYSVTGECTAEVEITFMAGKEKDEKEVITLTFDEDGGGNYSFKVVREDSPPQANGAFVVAFNEPPPNPES